MECNVWCPSTMRSMVFLWRHRGMRSQNKRKEGTGKIWLQVRHPVKHDGHPGPKTDQTNTSEFQKCPSCFTSIFVCTTVFASSCLPWPTVSLFCHSGKCLASHFHALFSVSPLPLRTPGDRLRILPLLFCLLKNPLHSGDTRQAPSSLSFLLCLHPA